MTKTLRDVCHHTSSTTLVQWSPLVRSTFCPKKFDHTSGLTIHPGCNKRLHVRPRAIYGCRLEFVIPSAAEAAVAAGVENTEAEVGLNSRRLTGFLNKKSQKKSIF